MKVYRNVDHAVSSAISVGSVGVPTAAKWQSQYSTGFVESLTSKNDDTIKMSRSDRLLQAAILAIKDKMREDRFVNDWRPAYYSAITTIELEVQKLKEC